MMMKLITVLFLFSMTLCHAQQTEQFIVQYVTYEDFKGSFQEYLPTVVSVTSVNDNPKSVYKIRIDCKAEFCSSYTIIINKILSIENNVILFSSDGDEVSIVRGFFGEIVKIIIHQPHGVNIIYKFPSNRA